MHSYLVGHKGHPHYITHSQIKNLQKEINRSSENQDLLTVIKNLSDPTKFKIYMILHKTKEISVSSISDTLGISQSSASHALSDLKKIGLVRSFRCGQLICYTLSKENKLIESNLKRFLNLL